MIIRREIFRIDPAVGPESYKTYQISAPISTHTRPATCGEIECVNYLRGFKLTADVSTDLGKKQANYVRLHSGRHFTSSVSGDLVTFVFAAGQQCFDQHRISLERRPNFLIRGGDYRGNPLGLPTRRLSATSWRDDFGEHQENLSGARERG